MCALRIPCIYIYVSCMVLWLKVAWSLSHWCQQKWDHGLTAERRCRAEDHSVQCETADKVCRRNRFHSVDSASRAVHERSGDTWRKEGQELVSLLEDDAFRIVSQMGLLCADTVEYAAVKTCLCRDSSRQRGWNLNGSVVRIQRSKKRQNHWLSLLEGCVPFLEGKRNTRNGHRGTGEGFINCIVAFPL